MKESMSKSKWWRILKVKIKNWGSLLIWLEIMRI